MIEKTTRRLLTVLSIPFALAARATAADSDDVRLRATDIPSTFHIEKSENKNQVHYGVHVNEACEPQGKEPVFGYWRMLEDKPVKLEPLLAREEPAYGLEGKQSVERSSAGWRIMTRLRAVKNRDVEIAVRKNGRSCAAKAYTLINGEKAELKSVFAKLGGLGKPDYVLVRGKRVDGKQPIEEKVKF